MQQSDRGTAPHSDWRHQMTQGITVAEVAKPKQTTRLRKVLCEVDGYIARISRSTLITYGSPICPACNQAMKEVK